MALPRWACASCGHHRYVHGLRGRGACGWCGCRCWRPGAKARRAALAALDVRYSVTIPPAPASIEVA